MRHLLPLALLVLAGCHGNQVEQVPPAPTAPVSYGGAWYPDALQGAIYFDHYSGFASVDLNRPAHIAVFALTPGGGTRMIYPAIGYGGRGRLDDGAHVIRTATSGYRFASTDRGLHPTYIMMIASDRPLELGVFRAMGTLPWLNRPSLSWSPYRTTEALASRIVPRPGLTDWTVAYHVVWPMAVPERQQPRYTWVRCPSGVVLSVPVQAFRRGIIPCPSQAAPTESEDTTDVKQRVAEARPEGGSEALAPWRRAGPGVDPRAPKRGPVAIPLEPKRPIDGGKHATPWRVRPEKRPLPPEVTRRPGAAVKPVAKPAPRTRPAPARRDPPPPAERGKKKGGSNSGGSGGF